MLTSRNPLGRTGLEVSPVALGTAALGIDYGLPGSPDFERPSFDSAVSLVRRSFDAGINFFDTAPAYGSAEDILGTALTGMPGVVIASKAAITWNDEAATAAYIAGELRRSVERSAMHLRRGRIDVLSLHSATEQNLRDVRLLRALDALREEGLVTAIGATVYGEKAALAAIDSGTIDVVQVPFNILDQRASRCVFPKAHSRGIGLVIRSALLKGALTRRWRTMPPELGKLQRAVRRVVDTMNLADSDLPLASIRFCFGFVPPVSSVLIGAASTVELEDALAAATAGPLPTQILSSIASLAIEDDVLINPSSWPVR
jgi:aryl-alcohol dehydrogenase-like predicted oxidoreductase